MRAAGRLLILAFFFMASMGPADLSTAATRDMVQKGVSLTLPLFQY